MNGSADVVWTAFAPPQSASTWRRSDWTARDHHARRKRRQGSDIKVTRSRV